MRKPKVLVLLTTYNGEKYLKEQIDSILNQKEVDVFLRIADDLSKDSTVKILDEYAKRDNVSYYVNKTNKGFAYNFIDLIYSIKDYREYDYFALSDQDDFWMDDKLVSGIQKIEGSHCSLYCSNLFLTDSSLKIYGKQNDETATKLTKYDFLVTNIANGCTTIMDREFLEKALTYYPRNIKFHDYWLFLIAVFTANYYYDSEPHIYYRQHQNNQVGSNQEFRIKGKLRRLAKNSNEMDVMIGEFLNGFGNNVDDKYKKYMTLIAGYKKHFSYRLKLFFSRKIKRSNHNFLFKLRILFGRY